MKSLFKILVWIFAAIGFAIAAMFGYYKATGKTPFWKQ